MPKEFLFVEFQDLMNLDPESRAGAIRKLGCDWSKSYSSFKPDSNDPERRYQHVLYPTAKHGEVISCKFDLLTPEGNRTPSPNGELVSMKLVNLKNLGIVSQALHSPEEILQRLSPNS